MRQERIYATMALNIIILILMYKNLEINFCILLKIKKTAQLRTQQQINKKI